MAARSTPGDGARTGPRRLRPFAVAVVSLLAATTLARPSAAGSSSATDRAERSLVSVAVAGDPASVEAVLEVLRERIGGADLEASFAVVPSIDRATVLTPGPSNDRQLARIWIDLSAPREGEDDAVTLYVVDGPWERVLVRPIARESNPEVTWEEIGHIVELALRALRAGERIGVARAELAPPRPSPPPPPPPAPPADRAAVTPAPPPRPVLRAGGYYAARAYGSGLELESGPGAVVELDQAAGRLSYGGMLTAEYRLPSTVDRGSALVRFEGAAIHAMASGDYALGGRHHLQLAAGAGVELVHARATGPALRQVRFSGGALEGFPTARVLARYAWSTTDMRLFAGLGLDLPLRSQRYLLARDAGPIVLFDPWAARPLLLLGIETN